MAIQGVRDTLNINQDSRVIDMSDVISLLDRNSVPLTLMAGHPFTDGSEDSMGKPKVSFAKRQAFQPEIKWLDDALISERSTLETADAGGATPYTYANIQLGNPADASIVRVGSLVLDTRTGEIMKVTAVNLTLNQIDLQADYPGTIGNAPGIIATDECIIMGGVNEEGASYPTAITTKKATRYNYLQTFRTPFEVTLIQAASRTYGGQDLNYQRKKEGIQHAKDIEAAFLFGERQETTGTNGQPERSTRGLINWISTNVTNVGGVMTESAFEAIVRDAFNYNSNSDNRKLLIASPLTCSVINAYGTNKLQHNVKDEVTGLRVMRYNSFHGTLDIVRHNMLRGTAYGGTGIIVDVGNLAYAFLSENGINLDTALYRDRQNPGEMKKVEEFITVAGLEVRQEKSFAIFNGVTG